MHLINTMSIIAICIQLFLKVSKLFKEPFKKQTSIN